MNKPWVRLVLASTMDGRISYPSGKKTQLGQEGDRAVLEEALAWSDGALFGGQTLREHKSVCLIKTTDLIKKREREGKSKQPIAIVVSNKIINSSDWIFFQQPIERWIITSNNNPENFYINRGYTKKLVLDSEWKNNLYKLYKVGINRIALLGGAILTSSLLSQDQVDEIQLTLTPKIIGGTGTWVTNQINSIPSCLSNNKSWHLQEIRHLIKNEVMLRYYRVREKE